MRINGSSVIPIESRKKPFGKVYSIKILSGKASNLFLNINLSDGGEHFHRKTTLTKHSFIRATGTGQALPSIICLNARYYYLFYINFGF